MLRGPVRLLFLHDSNNIRTALQIFSQHIRSDPNILFLGGQVEGTAAIASTIRRLLQYSTQDDIAPQIISNLAYPSLHTVQLLQYPSIQLLLLLQHHISILHDTQNSP
uniref:50S ribosomal protein L10 n=1 Tax=Lygus hesperus TaxID=30085 RepID=A0A0A9WLM2_LYGHE